MIAILWLVTTLAVAPDDPYAITPAERAACVADAERLCADTFPDEKRLLVCLRENRARLQPPCRASFDAGMKRRGL